MYFFYYSTDHYLVLYYTAYISTCVHLLIYFILWYFSQLFIYLSILFIEFCFPVLTSSIFILLSYSHFILFKFTDSERK